MTNLSSIGPGSARAMMDRRLDTAVSVGALRVEDKAALSVALDTVGQGLSARGDASAGSMKDRIDTLIAAQVDTGVLTRDQAGELATFFAPPSSPERGAASDSAAPSVATDAPRRPAVKTASEQIASFEAMLTRMRASLSPADIYGAGGAPSTGLVFNRDA